MKNLNLLFVLILSLLVFACAQKGEKKVEKEEVIIELTKEESFPDGYPQEITLPEGFKPRNISEGEGLSTGWKGDRTYKTYRIEKLMPKNRAVLIEHYKKIVEEQGWQGDWNFFDDGLGASGTFTKGNMEIEVKITDMLFTFTIRVFEE
jgi:hypothetical protein